MKPAAFAYARAASVPQAAAALEAAPGMARLIAGGQSLGPMLNLRLARPSHLVDITRTEGMRHLATGAGTLSIGAGWTHAEIEDGAAGDPAQGMLRHIAHGIAHRAVRNRGTLGGSLAHADPAADWVTTMAALGATLVARRADGSATRYAAESFVLGAYTTRLGETEVLEAIEMPLLSPSACWGYHKVCRKAGAFATAIGIAIHDPAQGRCRVLAGAVDGPPVLLPATAATLAKYGAQAAAGVVASELAACLPQLDPARRQIHTAAVCRALAMLAA